MEKGNILSSLNKIYLVLGNTIILLMCIILALLINKKRKKRTNKVELCLNKLELQVEGPGSRFRSNSFDDQEDDRVEMFMTPEGCTQPGNTAGNYELRFCSSSFDDQVDDRIETFMIPEGCIRPDNTAGNFEVGKFPS